MATVAQAMNSFTPALQQILYDKEYRKKNNIEFIESNARLQFKYDKTDKNIRTIYQK